MAYFPPIESVCTQFQVSSTPIALKRISNNRFLRLDSDSTPIKSHRDDSEKTETCTTKESDKSDLNFASRDKQEIRNNSQNPLDSGSPEPCYLCMDHAADAVLMECGHGGLCAACAAVLWQRGTLAPGGRQCPLCRQHFVGVLHIVSECGSKV